MFREIRGWHLAHLTAFSPRQEEFRQCLAQAFGIDPPATLYRGVTHGASRLVRLTADQYWWIAADETAMHRFAAQLAPETGALTSLSASRVRLCVEGAHARELLAKGIAIDLHPAHFAVGQSAQTGLHHTGIFLERIGPETYELFVQRTFATSIKEWLTDASFSFGVTAT
jgi:heterotetrameric sarcosine oxidase gamma subunit